ncbi:hypothetical protein J1N35_025967 [Gossypium stocksii]|uniref:Uncharacterized protein n=1 Tax=Gossypium stocksii TaxID=47602 RepID=A0A9D3ZYC2_9ROSI|nr:hypothetical protein J1N35_025967 [Gossypium stocksii]
MNTPICLTVEEFGDLLHFPSGGNSKEKDTFNLALFIPFGLASKLSLHDRVFHLILTWNLRPIMKRVKFQNTGYWWLDSIQTNRRPDLSLIMFNGITKVIRRAMSTNLTLPHGTYLSCIFRRRFFEHVPSSEHALLLALSFQASQPSSELNTAILDAIHSLGNDVRGLRKDVNTRLSTLES